MIWSLCPEIRPKASRWDKRVLDTNPHHSFPHSNNSFNFFFFFSRQHSVFVWFHLAHTASTILDSKFGQDSFCSNSCILYNKLATTQNCALDQSSLISTVLYSLIIILLILRISQYGILLRSMFQRYLVPQELIHSMQDLL